MVHPSPQQSLRGVRPFFALTLFAAVVAAAPTSFLIMGDWGGDEHKPYCTVSEKDTAASMNSEAEVLGSKFALALGDNFYHSGVENVNDKRFQETFEDIFAGDALSTRAGFKFHVVAGNHDHIGNVNAQIEYSNLSSRWVFPSLYYTFTEAAVDNATVQFVMLDTVSIAGNSQTEEGDLTGDALPGPADQAHADAQILWLEQTLAASTADYLLVGGHYPVYSVCEHGPTAALQDNVKPLLRKYKATAYLAGHDHCSEHIDVGDGVQYHGIGSAAYHVSAMSHKHTVLPSQLKFHGGENGGGFASVQVSKTEMLITHHTGLGDKIYNSTVSPRRMHDVVV